MLARALPYLPAGIHLAVVDPGVGGPRRSVAIRCADERRVLVGPDNGLLSLAAERFGGAVEAIDLERSPHRLEHVSATFHGRDVFAPVAAALAAGHRSRRRDSDRSRWARRARSAERSTRRRPRLRARAADRQLRQRDARRRPERWPIAGLAFGPDLAINGVAAHYGRIFDDVAPGELLLYEDAFGAIAWPSTVAPPRSCSAIDSTTTAAGTHMTLGAPRLHLASTDSTNERAKPLATGRRCHTARSSPRASRRRARPPGSLVARSAGEALLMSLVLHETTNLLPIIAAVAVAETIGPTKR